MPILSLFASEEGLIFGRFDLLQATEMVGTGEAITMRTVLRLADPFPWNPTRTLSRSKPWLSCTRCNKTSRTSTQTPEVCLPCTMRRARGAEPWLQWRRRPWALGAPLVSHTAQATWTSAAPRMLSSSRSRWPSPKLLSLIWRLSEAALPRKPLQRAAAMRPRTYLPQRWSWSGRGDCGCSKRWHSLVARKPETPNPIPDQSWWLLHDCTRWSIAAGLQTGSQNPSNLWMVISDVDLSRKG